MEAGSFRGLAIVAAVGFFVPLLLGFVPRLRVPSVVMEIAVGAVLGPSALGWVHVDEPIRIFSQLGLASLLFLAGLETELDRLRGGLLRLAFRGFLLSLLLSVAFCYALRAVGLLETPLFVAIILASSAIGIVIPLLKDAGELGTPFGQAVIVGISIADFGTVLLLTLLFSAGGGGTAKTLFLLAVVGLLCALVAKGAGSLGHWERLSQILVRLQDTSAMIRIRGAAPPLPVQPLGTLVVVLADPKPDGLFGNTQPRGDLVGRERPDRRQPNGQPPLVALLIGGLAHPNL